MSSTLPGVEPPRANAADIDPVRPSQYVRPELTRLGDLRTVTLGGSLGRGDSGAPTRQSRPGGI